MIASNRQMMPLTIVELLAALAIGIGSPEAGIHLAHAAIAGHMQSMINYTREHEQEADRMGMQLLAKTHYDPNGMAAVFQHLRKKSTYQSHPPEYLMTHPVFDSRIADAQNRAMSLHVHPVPDSLFFHLIRARLEVIKDQSLTRKTANRKISK
jgi:predicted Zn-dependent protease